MVQGVADNLAGELLLRKLARLNLQRRGLGRHVAVANDIDVALKLNIIPLSCRQH